MKRTKLKCVMASTSLHILMMALAVFGGMAFKEKYKEPENLTLLKFIPAKLVDAPFSGGGNPKAVLPPAPRDNPLPPAPAPAPVPQPPAPTPQPPEPKVEAKKREPEPEPEPAPVKTQSVSKLPSLEKTPKKKPDTTDLLEATKIKSTSGKSKPTASKSKTSSTSNKATSEAWQRNVARTFGDVTGSIRSQGAKAEVFDLPGQGGGEAYASYKDAVYTIYYNAWNPADDVMESAASVQARIVVSRDGTVTDWTLTKRSGVPMLDKSVESTLRRVTKLPPFPDGAPDPQRKFLINFNLKAKRSLG